MADPTSRDFMDWRTRFANATPPLRQNMLNSQNDSAGVMEAINNMPYVFDPRKFLGQPGNYTQIGQSQGQISQAVNPNKLSPAAVAQLGGLPAPITATTAPPSDFQGLLQMLGPQFGPLLNSLFPGRS